MIRSFAKSLALTVPPIRRLYEEKAKIADLDRRLGYVASQPGLEDPYVGEIVELQNKVDDLERWHVTELPRATALQSLLNRLILLGLGHGAAAVKAEMEGGIGNGRDVDRDGALRELIYFIQRKEWECIPEYRTTARLIESLAAGRPPAEDIADALTKLSEDLLCLRNLPASHYSYIFFQRKPGTGEKFDGSYSPEGLISNEEKNALIAFLAEVAAPGMRVAEVGCFLGRGSTRAIAEAVRPYGGAVVVVDDFPVFAGFADQRELFEQSATALGFRNLLQVIAGNGRKVAARFPDGHFDLIYIDAGHSFSEVDADIKAWLPKVRAGGIICGHDCIRTADEFSDAEMAIINANREMTALSIEDPRNRAQKVHACPGVILAVAENFGNSAKVYGGPLGVWSYHIPK